MRRSNQFDPDAYGDPPRTKVGGCSPFMLMLMLGLGFFFYLQLQGKSNERRNPARGTPSEVQRLPENGRAKSDIPQGRRRADSNDWSIEEVDTADGANAGKTAVRSDGLLNENLPDAGEERVNPQDRKAPRGQAAESSEPQRTDRGDWTIEEVESEQPSPSKPKSTKKGDWEIEEVAE